MSPSIQLSAALYITSCLLTRKLFFFFLSRVPHIRPLPVFKPAGSPTANRDAELYAPYRTPPRAASSSTTNSSSCNSSPTSRYKNTAFIACIIDNRLTDCGFINFLYMLSWSCLTFPGFSTMSHYKSDLPCLRQVSFGDLRDLGCSSGRVQHNDEWVGGWIKLRLFCAISSLAPARDYIGHDLAVVGITEGFNIANVWICFPDSDPIDGSWLVTGLEWAHHGLEERTGSWIFQNGSIDVLSWRAWSSKVFGTTVNFWNGAPGSVLLGRFSLALWLLAAPLCIRLDLKKCSLSSITDKPSTHRLVSFYTVAECVPFFILCLQPPWMHHHPLSLSL